MATKNPYENGVDIPDFVERKTDDIDMSVFKMAESDNTTNIDMDYEDEEYDDEPRKKLSSKGLLVICAVVMVLLLIAAVSGWIFGISKSNSLAKLQNEYTTLQTKFNDTDAQITSLQNQVTLLNTELEKYKTSNNTSSGNKEEQPNTKYKMEADISVRKSAGSKEYADFSKLPDAVADELYNNEELKTLTTRDGAILPVYETKTVDGNTWGRIADNAWVCLVYQGETWGTKQ